VAEDRAQRLERHHYASLIRMAQRDWDEGHVEKAQELLGDLRRESSPDALPRFSWSYLWRLASRDVLLLRGHQTEVYPLAVSPSGRFLASGDIGGTVILWNPTDGQRLAVLSDPAARRVIALAVSPDDRLLASAADTQNRRSEIILWDVATGRRRGTLPTGSEPVHALAFGPKGATLAVLCNVPDGPSRVLKVWDVSRLPEPPVLRWTLPHLNEIALAPNGRALATVDHLGETTVRDLASGQLTVVCQGGAFLSNGLTFSPDGRRLYSGGQEQDVQSWELPSGRPLVRFETDYWIKQFIVAPDGQTLATTNHEGRLDLWNALSGQRLNAL
jgi:WD40 repeat protein